MLAYPLAHDRPTPGLQPGEMLSLGMRGKVGAAAGCGFATCGAALAGGTAWGAGIYQSRLNGYNQYHSDRVGKRKRYYVLMRPYAPTNPRTIPQQANRTKFADARAAWQSLTNEEKRKYNERGAKQGLPGHCLFTRWYMAAH